MGLEVVFLYWDSVGGAEGGTGVAWAGGGAEKGREPGRGGGWGPGGGRAAGGSDGWGIPLRVRSPALLASVCERNAKFSALVAAAPSAPAATTRPAPGAARLRRPAVR